MKPNRHKMALLTWLVVYPLITILSVLLEPLVVTLPMPLRTLLLSAAMVPAMVYLALPFVTRRLEGWLTATKET